MQCRKCQATTIKLITDVTYVFKNKRQKERKDKIEKEKKGDMMVIGTQNLFASKNSFETRNMILISVSLQIE